MSSTNESNESNESDILITGTPNTFDHTCKIDATENFDFEGFVVRGFADIELGNLRARDSAIGIKIMGKPVLEFNDPYHNLFWGYQSGTFASGVSANDNGTFTSGVSANDVCTTSASAVMNTGIGCFTLETLRDGDNNTAIGAYALKNAVVANNNTAVGANALHDLITGNNNVAFGYQALEQNASGDRNIGIGVAALQLGVSTNDSTAIGYFALSDNTDGYENIAIGNYSLRYNECGFKDTAVGVNALFNNTTGKKNTAVGHNAMHNNLSGDLNAAFGSSVLALLETGHLNVAMGASALCALVSGDNNVGIGAETGSTLVKGSNNVLVGSGANVGTGTAAAIDRIAIGTNAIAAADRDVQLGSDLNTGNGGNKCGTSEGGRLRFRKQTIAMESWADTNVQLAYIDGEGNFRKGGSGSGNGGVVVSLTSTLNMESGSITNAKNVSVDNLYSTDGKKKPIAFQCEPIIGYKDSAKNQFWGFKSGRLLTSGQRNTAIGCNSMEKVTNGNDNTAGGYDSLSAVNMGSNNTAFGRASLTLLTTGSNNTAIGRLAGWKADSVNRTTAVGSSALQENTTGNDNTAIGFNALQMTTGAYNTAVGTEAGSSLTSGQNNVIIGKDAGSAGAYSHLSAIALQTGDKNVIIGCTTDVDGPDVSESVILGYKSVGTSGGVAIGYNTEATGTNSIAIGRAAVASMSNHVQFGESVDSKTAATMKFRSQIIGDEKWIDDTNQLCVIDRLGNLIKGVNTAVSINATLDMQCNVISNTEQLITNQVTTNQVTTNQVITNQINANDAQRIQFNETTSLYRLSATTTNGKPTHGALLLLDNLTKPILPMGARWCGTIELVGGIPNTSDMYCGRKTFSAINFGGTVSVSVWESDHNSSISLEGTLLSVVGNVSGELDVTVVSAAVNTTTKWVATLLITELII